jgi:Mrp family chromosome partitioning ATPase
MIGKYGLKLVQATPGLEYLSILPAGRLSDKPSELLSTPAVEQLLAYARQNFDVVIVDAAPILPVADGFVLAPKMDAIILAYQVGRVARDVLRRTKVRLQNVGGNVVGVILNDIQAEIGARHSDFSYYSYGYGEAFDLQRTRFDRLKRIFRRGSKSKRQLRRNADAMNFRQKPPSASGGSQEVREIMSITDDDQT